MSVVTTETVAEKFGEELTLIHHAPAHPAILIQAGVCLGLDWNAAIRRARELGWKLESDWPDVDTGSIDIYFLVRIEED